MTAENQNQITCKLCLVRPEIFGKSQECCFHRFLHRVFAAILMLCNVLMHHLTLCLQGIPAGAIFVK